MAVLAWRRRSDGDTIAAPLPTVSVILATRESDSVVRARVADFLDTTFPADKLEVVVALDPRGAAPEAPAPQFADERVRVVIGDAPGGKAATLNAAVRASRGEALVFSDAAQRFRPDVIPRLAAALSDLRLGAVSGRLNFPDGPERTLSYWYWVYELSLRRNEARVHSTVGVTGAIYCLRASLWQALPPGLILDDVYTAMHVVLSGHRVGFVDAARARETRDIGLEQEFDRKVRTLTGNIQLCAWLPAVLSPRRNPIWAQFVCHKLLRLLTPYFVLGVGLYVAVAATGWLLTHVTALVVLLAGVVLVSLINRGRFVRFTVRTLLWATAMQWAVLTATVNGLRGRWDVWQK